MNRRQTVGHLYKSYYINIRNIKLWETQVIQAQDVLGLRPRSPLPPSLTLFGFWPRIDLFLYLQIVISFRDV